MDKASERRCADQKASERLTWSKSPARRGLPAGETTSLGAGPHLAGLALPRTTRGWGGVIVVALAWVGLGGCIRGSLATNTGPNGPHGWSTDNRQDAHVGETVGFSFILVKPFSKKPIAPYGYVDYCLATVGNRRVECECDLGGRFRFEHPLGEVEPDRQVEIKVIAYRQYGKRDFMLVGDTWMRGHSPYDQPDAKFASDALTLRIYQAKVELRICEQETPLDIDRGRLELIKADGTVSTVSPSRPGRPGFDVSGPDDQGCYSMVYLPDGRQLAPAGTTVARLTVPDRSGHPHTVEDLIETP